MATEAIATNEIKFPTFKLDGVELKFTEFKNIRSAANMYGLDDVRVFVPNSIFLRKKRKSPPELVECRILPCEPGTPEVHTADFLIYEIVLEPVNKSYPFRKFSVFDMDFDLKMHTDVYYVEVGGQRLTFGENMRNVPRLTEGTKSRVQAGDIVRVKFQKTVLVGNVEENCNVHEIVRVLRVEGDTSKTIYFMDNDDFSEQSCSAYFIEEFLHQSITEKVFGSVSYITNFNIEEMQMYQEAIVAANEENHLAVCHLPIPKEDDDWLDPELDGYNAEANIGMLGSLVSYGYPKDLCNFWKVFESVRDRRKQQERW